MGLSNHSLIQTPTFAYFCFTIFVKSIRMECLTFFCHHLPTKRMWQDYLWRYEAGTPPFVLGLCPHTYLLQKQLFLIIFSPQQTLLVSYHFISTLYQKCRTRDQIQLLLHDRYILHLRFSYIFMNHLLLQSYNVTFYSLLTFCFKALMLHFQTGSMCTLAKTY